MSFAPDLILHKYRKAGKYSLIITINHKNTVKIKLRTFFYDKPEDKPFSLLNNFIHHLNQTIFKCIFFFIPLAFNWL